MEKDMRVFKKGTNILLKRSINGASSIEGKVCEIVNETTSISGSIRVKAEDRNGTWSVCPNDDFHLVDRKEQARYLKIKVEDMKTEIKVMEAEIERLEKFETEEDYVAFKINKLLKAKGTKQMAEILRTLKESNYL